MEHVKWLDNGVRRFVHNPRRMFGSYLKQGGVAFDIGCGPGVFTEGLARIVGEGGKVIAVDVQQALLDLARQKVAVAGLTDRVEFHKCTIDTLGLSIAADFILTFYMIHESPRPMRLVNEICMLLKPGGYWFLAEPKMHVSTSAYQEVLEQCRKNDLTLVKKKGIFSRIAVFTR